MLAVSGLREISITGSEKREEYQKYVSIYHFSGIILIKEKNMSFQSETVNPEAAEATSGHCISSFEKGSQAS